jgi:Ni2+-binding GTPase involved in maturation of urease and hydrogenase
MEKISITITGPTGSGKTTLAIEITEALEGLGFNVEMRDVDGTYTRNDARLASVVAMAPAITVTTAQTKRSRG